MNPIAYYPGRLLLTFATFLPLVGANVCGQEVTVGGPDHSGSGRRAALSHGETNPQKTQAAYPMELSAETQKLAEELKSRLAPGTEARAMLDAIMRGERLQPNVGWFALSKSQTLLDWKFIVAQLDADKSGQIDAAELPDHQLFQAIDRDGDEMITEADFQWDDEPSGVESKPKAAARNKKPSSNLSREVLIQGLAKQEIGSLEPGPKVGEIAPNFQLSTFDGKSTVELHREIGEQPLVLVFGNFTCGPFRRQSQAVKEVYESMKDRAKFMMVYVREAHPLGGWHSQDWGKAFLIEQPKTQPERLAVAKRCREFIEFDFPFLVDEIKDPVGTQYSGMPSRLYLIDRSGRIVYKSARGPHGFKPREMQQALALLLACEAD